MIRPHLTDSTADIHPKAGDHLQAITFASGRKASQYLISWKKQNSLDSVVLNV